MRCVKGVMLLSTRCTQPSAKVGPIQSLQASPVTAWAGVLVSAR